MHHTSARDRSFAEDLGIVHTSPNYAILDAQDHKTSDCGFLSRCRTSSACAKQPHNQCFVECGESEDVRSCSDGRRLNDAAGSISTEFHADDEPSQFHTNRPISERTLLRNDSVTARAISRLSRRVSQLSASTSPTLPRTFRTTRSTHSDKKNEVHIPDSFGQHLDTHSHGDLVKKPPTGSKRKWQAERTGSHSKMDVDSVGVCAEASRNNQHPWMEAVDCSSRASFFLQNEADRCFSMDHLDCVGQFSSGSSMLSVTGSSNEGESGGSSLEHEADEEDAGDGEPLGSRRSSTRSCTDLFGTPKPLHRKSARDGNFLTELRMTSRASVCGGDSSDGLSVNLKIPRLSSGVSPFSASSAASRKHGRRFGALPLRSTAQHFSGSTSNSCHHGLHSKGHVSRAHDSARRKPERGLCVHKRSQPSSQSRHSTMCTCQSSTSPSSSSSHERSLDGSYAHTSPESCEDLANDEQSDFPADEASTPFRYRRVLHSVSTRTAKLTADSDRPFRKSESSIQWYGRSPGGCTTSTRESLLLSDLDSEFEEILKGTWPLLSQRAKAGYVNSISQADGRRLGSHSLWQCEPKDAQGRKKLMTFVPSTLGQVTDSTKRDTKTKRVPTPPWVEKDGDNLHEETAPASPFNSEVTNLNDLSTTGSYPGLGCYKHQPPEAPPIPESNHGHKLLQRMGWKTGSGLGAHQQGRLHPVGCSERNTMKSQ
ncbi:hypothetical protein CRM22_005685 [Opisthorchis felineus]|uniref:G-patch domain-containing protein n=1 Tax=Opisthorchis felineus TaxID=147828 RepID=A0A4S2LX65_OPIFE|nr:hypothetical protein CRM22_005685 [Opisthorchis felineus]TGZ65767.1 hypothetical protein CRM22_005685 [Opisthorchis felineus]